MNSKHGIIVEGCDCSGKTTLVKLLKVRLSEYGWDVLDLGHKGGDQFVRYAGIYSSIDGVILDRAHFSEIVYGDLWRAGRHFHPWERALLDYLAYERFLVVLCTAPEQVLLERHRTREYTQIIDLSELSRVQNGFVALLDHDRVIRYESVDRQRLEDAVGRIVHALHDGATLSGSVKARPRMSRDDGRFVVLEGANGSGKSTLAKLLKVNAVGWSVCTLDYDPVTRPFERFLSAYVNGQRHIFDRGHFSEVVYGDMFRQGQHFSPEELEHLNRFVRERAVVVLCEPAVRVMEERIRGARYPKHIHPGRLVEVSERFRRVLDKASVDYIVAKTDKADEVERVVAEVTAQLGSRAYHEMGWDAPGGVD